MARRPIFLVLAIAAVATIVALPALAADPSPATGPGSSAKPEKVKVDKTPITVSGTVETSTDGQGGTTYSIRSGGTTYTLDAGPAWFLGANHPLKQFVGKSVTIAGERAGTSTEVDVKSVNGTTLRADGKPAWAGGWKRIGQAHPGWSQDKASRFKAKFGDCFPPGHCARKPATSAASPAPTH